ncbi:hypothetical protein D5H75_11740 [Bailinhaonella thermotolerans]|uniref:Uncharacterized protein n=1 Tax=Bailinhaonella thermotolerans TaxID=1070861 RepID=A0A3A4ATY0_9ACTN|nr:hypothetical protein D5H75_11740 [Bailinhaonella thermotolerans]
MTWENAARRDQGRAAVRRATASRGGEPLRERGAAGAERGAASRRGRPRGRGGASARGGRSGPRRPRTPLHYQPIAHRGACGKTPVMAHNRRPRPVPAETGDWTGAWGR